MPLENLSEPEQLAAWEEAGICAGMALGSESILVLHTGFPQTFSFLC